MLLNKCLTGYMAAVYVLLSVSLKLNFLGEAECPSAKNIFCTFAKGLLPSYPRTISFLK